MVDKNPIRAIEKTLEGRLTEDVVETPKEPKEKKGVLSLGERLLIGFAGVAFTGVIIAGLLSQSGLPRITQIFYPTSQEQLNPTATYESLPATETSIPTEIPPTKTPRNTPTPEFSGPFREHYTVSTGTGPLSDATTSDGMQSWSEDWLWANNHFKIQRIRPEEQPDGCGISKYDVNKIWISSNVPTSITVDGESIGYLYKTNSHGYIFDYNLKKGEEICVSTVGKYGYQIIFGPDIYFHYDSYCYRGNCN